MSSSGSSLVRATRMVVRWSWLLRRFWAICPASIRPTARSMTMQSGWKLSARMPASKPEAAVSIRKSSPSRRCSRSEAEHRGVGADDEDLVIDLGLEVAQRHPVLFEEPEQVLAGDPPVLRAGDPISAQAARVEPLAHGPGRDLADLRDLAGCEHFLHIEDSTPWNGARPRRFPLPSGRTQVGAAARPCLAIGPGPKRPDRPRVRLALCGRTLLRRSRTRPEARPAGAPPRGRPARLRAAAGPEGPTTDHRVREAPRASAGGLTGPGPLKGSLLPPCRSEPDRQD